jgi:hypothetical protein
MMRRDPATGEWMKFYDSEESAVPSEPTAP